VNSEKADMTDHLIRPITETGRSYVALFVFLGVIAAWGFAVWVYQVYRGLGVTGMTNSVNWGVYITNFVFFIGISHAGTLISAILRVSGAEWRRPITRVAEAITVFALVLGALQIFIDLGRPDRAMNLFFHGRLGSPLLWDLNCVSVYLLSSIFYLFLPLIPDLSVLREHGKVVGWRKDLYRILAVGWRGNKEQKRRLEKAIGIMAVAIIPIAISVHTVVSWIFGMTPRPMWHTTILGPYFVVGAIFSGIAALIIAMAVIRKVYAFEAYLKPIHFNYLGILLLTMTSLWFYFTFAEFLTTGYVGLTEEWEVFTSKVTGQFSPLFWFMAVAMTVAFFLLALARRKWPIGSTCIASALIIVGMWIERYSIIVPTLTKYNEHGQAVHIYAPTWVEWSITLGSVAGFVLLYVIFAKLFPLISIWEVEEGDEALKMRLQTMKSYLPDKTALRNQRNG
jgi:molybdopterin-containing oxidoreductase family membrane subunit